MDWKTQGSHDVKSRCQDVKLTYKFNAISTQSPKYFCRFKQADPKIYIEGQRK